MNSETRRPTLKVQLFPGIGDDRMLYHFRGSAPDHPGPGSTQEESNGNVVISKFTLNARK